jgi:hypothetical protein
VETVGMENWAYPFDPELQVGYQVRSQARDKAGNKEVPAAWKEFVLVTPPPAPAVSSSGVAASAGSPAARSRRGKSGIANVIPFCSIGSSAKSDPPSSTPVVSLALLMTLIAAVMGRLRKTQQG